jgi:hypothetical protein
MYVDSLAGGIRTYQKPKRTPGPLLCLDAGTIFDGQELLDASR